MANISDRDLYDAALSLLPESARDGARNEIADVARLAERQDERREAFPSFASIRDGKQARIDLAERLKADVIRVSEGRYNARRATGSCDDLDLVAKHKIADDLRFVEHIDAFIDRWTQSLNHYPPRRGDRRNISDHVEGSLSWFVARACHQIYCNAYDVFAVPIENDFQDFAFLVYEIATGDAPDDCGNTGMPDACRRIIRYWRDQEDKNQIIEIKPI